MNVDLLSLSAPDPTAVGSGATQTAPGTGFADLMAQLKASDDVGLSSDNAGEETARVTPESDADLTSTAGQDEWAAAVAQWATSQRSSPAPERDTDAEASAARLNATDTAEADADATRRVDFVVPVSVTPTPPVFDATTGDESTTGSAPESIAESASALVGNDAGVANASDSVALPARDAQAPTVAAQWPDDGDVVDADSPKNADAASRRWVAALIRRSADGETAPSPDAGSVPSTTRAEGEAHVLDAARPLSRPTTGPIDVRALAHALAVGGVISDLGTPSQPDASLDESAIIRATLAHDDQSLAVSAAESTDPPSASTPDAGARHPLRDEAPHTTATAAASPAAIAAVATSGHSSNGGLTDDAPHGRRGDSSGLGAARTAHALQVFAALERAGHTEFSEVSSGHEGPSLPNETQVAATLVQSLRLQMREGGGTAVVNLDPEYLGAVTIALSVDRGAVTATLHAANGEVRAWLQANEALLRDGLADKGFALARFVVSDDERGDGAPRDNDRRRDAERPRRRALPADDTSTFELVA